MFIMAAAVPADYYLARLLEAAQMALERQVHSDVVDEEQVRTYIRCILNTHWNLSLVVRLGTEQDITRVTSSTT